MKGRKVSLSSDEVEIIIPSGDMQVSSERQRNSKTNILMIQPHIGRRMSTSALGAKFAFGVRNFVFARWTSFGFSFFILSRTRKVTAVKKVMLCSRNQVNSYGKFYGSTITLFESKDVIKFQ